MKATSRRDFFKTISDSLVPVGVAGGMVGLFRGLVHGLLAEPSAPEAAEGMQRLRPPGAVDEEEFRARCIQCFACGEVCPVEAIRFAETGPGAHTPFLIARERGCNLCMKCPPACPTGALVPVEPEAVDMGLAEVNTRACLPYINASLCGACYGYCPVPGALIPTEFNRPVVNADKCVGCGRCEEICIVPSKAIRVRPRAG